MSINAVKRSAARRFFAPLFAAPVRCHAVGGLLTLLFVGISVWLVQSSERFATAPDISDEQLEQAVSLIAAKQSLDQRYQSVQAINRTRKQKIDDIAGWLPESRSWGETLASLQELASRCNVRISTIDREKEHVGTRISVLEANCGLHGSYGGICQFLDELTKLPHPIWADEISIRRTLGSNAMELKGNAAFELPQCTASVSLRIPFAGAGTTAQKVLRLRNSHAG